jgi:hypothetical protein
VASGEWRVASGEWRVANPAPIFTTCGPVDKSGQGRMTFLLKSIKKKSGLGATSSISSAIGCHENDSLLVLPLQNGIQNPMNADISNKSIQPR